VVDYEALRRENPGLIMVRMPAFGVTGPYRNYRALGMHMEGAVGHTWIRGYTDTDPSQRGDVVVADAATGLAAAFAVVAALRHRRRTGQGQLIELATAENFIPFVSDSLLDYAMNGRVQGPLGNRHRWMAPHGCYPCRGEDQWIAIAVGSDEQWRGLCRAMGDPAWRREERFQDSLGRWKHQDELDERIAVWTRDRDATELMEQLQQEGVPAGRVSNEADLLHDPHLRARGFFQPLEHVEAGTYDYPGTLWRVDGQRPPLRRAPPRLGEDNEYVFKELLGLTEEEYRELEAEGHIGMDYVEGA
jgi:crotonobetainyl-CoA:carnitine CoA-transferase CaiB-like acyl-CoA transferase